MSSFDSINLLICVLGGEIVFYFTDFYLYFRSWRDHDKFEESSYRKSGSPSRSRSPRTFDSSRKSRSQDYRGLRSPSPDRIGWRQNEKRFGDRGRYELEEEPRRDTSQGGWRDDWRIGERCELCKKENHASEDCPNYFCNKCHTQGHFAKVDFFSFLLINSKKNKYF